MLLSASLSAGAQTWLRGDADGDGEISSLDVTAVQRVAAGLSRDVGGGVALRCDMTGDGLSLPDATAIQRYLAGLSDRYHVGELCSGDDVFEPTEDNQLPILKK